MKFFFLFLNLSFVFSQQFYSEDFAFNFGKKDFDNATVTLINGQILIGEVQDFKSLNTIEFIGTNPFNLPKTIVEEITQKTTLDREKIKFRKNKSEKHRLIPSDSIDVIAFFDDELNKHIEFKRLTIYRSIKDKVFKTDQNLFLPLFLKDDINLYGFHLYSDNQYATTIFYLNNPKNNIAMCPYDLRFIELLSAQKKIIERAKVSFKFVSGDCPEFHQWLEESFFDITNEAMKNDMKQQYKLTVKEINEGKKKLKTEEERKAFENNKWATYYMRMFIPTIEKYKELCK